MAKKIVVDQNLCVGCGTCVNMCPEVFEMNDNGKAQVIKPEGCINCDCETVVNICPVEAIRIEE